MLAVVADGLVGHRRVAGAGGAALVPDLARAIPAPSDGGLTYRFQLRPGLRYSTGAPVHASDVRASIERLHRMAALTLDSYPLELRGQAACSRQRCDLSAGIVTDDATGTVTFHLRRPNPDFLLNLAAPPYDVLPAGAPLHDLAGPHLIGTGPYRVASASSTQVTLGRNPRFHAWSTEAQPDGFADRIVWRITKPDDHAADRTADIALDPDPAGVDSLRLSAPTRVRVTTYPQVSYIWLNTRVAPFDHPRARRAFAYAIDRRALARTFHPPGALLRPSCQLLPPVLPGYDPYCPYASDPKAGSAAAAEPDLDRARRLVARSGTAGTRVSFWVRKDPPTELVHGILQTLRRIGYRATAEARLRVDRYTAWTQDAAHRTQAGLSLWIADIPTASNVVPAAALLRGRGPPRPVPQQPGAILRSLAGHAHGPRSRTRSHRAGRRQRPLGPHRPRDRPARPDRPALSWQGFQVTSARLGNYQYQFPLGPLLAQAWVR